MSRPHRTARVEVHAVPDDMKMLPSVFDVFDDDALMLTRLVAKFLLTAFDYLQHLGIRQPLVFVRVDADVVQGLGASRIARHGPHILKRFIKVSGVRVADLDETYLFVFSDSLEVIGSSPVTATDVALDDNGLIPAHFPRSQSPPDRPMDLQGRAGENGNHRLALAFGNKPRI